jgi:hypothetical protein
MRTQPRTALPAAPRVHAFPRILPRFSAGVCRRGAKRRACDAKNTAAPHLLVCVGSSVRLVRWFPLVTVYCGFIYAGITVVVPSFVTRWVFGGLTACSRALAAGLDRRVLCPDRRSMADVGDLHDLCSSPGRCDVPRMSIFACAVLTSTIPCRAGPYARGIARQAAANAHCRNALGSASVGGHGLSCLQRILAPLPSSEPASHPLSPHIPCNFWHFCMHF